MKSVSLYLFAVACCFLFTRCEKDNHIETIINNYAFNDSSSLHPMNAVFTELVKKYNAEGYPGFVLCEYDSINGLWIGAAGKSCIETNTPMTITTLHHSASVSKMYIATTILKLYEQGKLRLDDHVKDYLPADVSEIANLGKATIKNLLNHTSGIFDFDNDPKIYADQINDPFCVKSWRDHLNRYVKGKNAVFPVGAGVDYSNTNFTLLGLIIENVTKKPLGDVIDELIIKPCGLTETYYKSSPGYPAIPGIPNSYFEHYDGTIQNCTDMQLHFSSVSMGHEGMIASPRNYVMFLHQLLGNKILKPETLALMKEFVDVPNSTINFGLGLFSVDTPIGEVIGHSGGGFGTMTFLIQIPDKKRTIFFATNLGSIFKSDLSDKFYTDVLYDIVEKSEY